MGVIVALAAAVFAGLVVRLVGLHLFPSERLKSKIEQKRRIVQPILVGRGRILDARGRPVAMDLTVQDVCADPQSLLKDGYAQAVGRHLARLLQLEPAVVLAKLNRPDRRFVYVRRQVPDELAEDVRALKLRHVWFQPVSGRHYPHGRILSHVVGFSNLDGVGSAGAEQKLDAYLRGRPGIRISERDGAGREQLDRRILEIAPQTGADVYLTLDLDLQQIVETALDNAMREHSARGAWAAVVRVRTGEILAMASRPDFDLNEYARTDEEQRLNRALGVVYEPGSIFKIAVVAAALNEGVVTPDDVFFCENGLWHFRGRPLHDFHPYGNLTVADIVKKSSNIGAAKIAVLKLGEPLLEKYLVDFGIGRPTGVDLPGEEGGIFRPRSRWTSLSASRIAMGHEVGVTALQMVMVLSAIANDGFLMKPSVVKDVCDARGRRLYAFEPTVVSRPIRGDTARTMLRLLARVTEEGGTGRRAAIPGYTVAGKTGTAEKLVNGRYTNALNVASFMGVVPAEQPALAIIVTVDEPQPEHTGGVVAAPVFREIAEQAVRILDIPPSGVVRPIQPASDESWPGDSPDREPREVLRDPEPSV
jgi:cell division protein FtsI (penicillin-binding protein 3)